MSDLQRKLAKSKMASHERKEHDAHGSPWPREAWEQAYKALADGTFRRPELRLPVILAPDSPVSSPEHLQQLAELETLPETIEATQVAWDGAEVKKVLISHVSLDDMKKMEAKADVLSGIEERTYVMFQGQKRFAAVVKALNEGVKLSAWVPMSMPDRDVDRCR